METSVKKAGGVDSPDRKSLDLKSLYSSRVSDVGVSKKVLEGNDQGYVRKKKRKNGKGASFSCIELDAKKSRKEGENGAKSESDFSHESSGGSKLLHGVTFAMGKNGNAFNIPKRPRDLVRRKKLRSGQVSEPLDHTNSDDCAIIINANANNSPCPKDQLGRSDPVFVVNDGSINTKSAGDTCGSKLKRKKKVKCKSTGTIGSSDSKLKRKHVAEDVKKARKDRPSVVHAEEEVNPVVENDQKSSKKQRRNSRKKKDSIAGRDGGKASIKKSEPSVGSSKSDSQFVAFQDDDDDEENLEQNAARMLSSRFDPSCTGFPSKKESSVSRTADGFSCPVSPGQDSFSLQDNSVGAMESAAVDGKSRALRPRSEDKGKGIPRKRRHFYDVVPNSLDACWFKNRRIKVFWPLDESWYHGLVDDYHPECKLHHIKYDDRDEEWVDLHEEKFKVLLLPSEVPGKQKPRKKSEGNKNAHNGKSVPPLIDDSSMENYLDSEPISSWLARSVPKSLKRQKISQVNQPLGSSFSSEKTDESNSKLADSKGGDDGPECESASADETLGGGSFNQSLMNVGSSLSCEKTDFNTEFSGSKKSRNEPDCMSTSTDKMPVHRSLGQCLIGTNNSSQNVVYVRRKYDLRCKLGSSLATVVKSPGTSTGTDTIEPVMVTFPAVKNESCTGYVDSDRKFGLVEAQDELEIDVVPVMPQEIRVQICLPLLPLLYSLETHNIWLLHNMLMLHYGSVVAVSPAVVLEMLFIDRNLGLRCLLFEGCLNQALALVFLILIACGGQDEQWNGDVLLPMASVRFKLFSFQDVNKKHTIASYSYSGLPPSKCLYLDSKLMQHCRLVKQLPVSECSHDDITQLECVNFQQCKPQLALEISSLEVEEFTPINVEDITKEDKLLKLETKAPAFWGLSSCEQELETVALGRNVEKVYSSENHQKAPSPPTSLISSASDSRVDNRSAGVLVDIPCFDLTDMASRQNSGVVCNVRDGSVLGANPIGSMHLWQHGRSRSISSPLGDNSPLWPDGKPNFVHNGFSNGPKRPRTQVQYTLPFSGYDLNSKQKMQNNKALPCKRIRRASQKRIPDDSKGGKKYLELLECSANVLVTQGDKGWRESGAHIFLEVADHNEWRLAVKFSGTTKYSYKVTHILQPGSTNRFSHAMMWRGGNDWVLEFPDRSQWALFKEMHEECYNRNIRAASVKHIPIPGVWLVEERNDCGTEVPFVRNHTKYFRQVQTDVEMAMDPSRVLYDLDSEDEQWLEAKNKSTDKHLCEEMSDVFMEKIIDMFEKGAYIQCRDNFTDAEIEELVMGIGYLEAAKVVYEYWRQKRERKGMPLIRHLQPPLWGQYQHQLKEWELVARGTASFPVSHLEKPSMFAFCLKPRGLDIPNKGSKQRSHRKFSVSGHHNTTSGDQDCLHTYGRRQNGHTFADEKLLYSNTVHESSDISPTLQGSNRLWSPRDTFFSLSTNVPEWNRNQKVFKYNPTNLSLNNQQMMSYSQRTIGHRNGAHQWNMDLPEFSGQKPNFFDGTHRQGVELLKGSDLHELRLRDASRAAQQAHKMAKLKRENAHRLFSKAEFAIHKAVVALMTAEAIRAANENFVADN
ncbi:hypothetical protein F511_00445 [Dorcoceras hygrometricum]|uniref:Enhancer of polycomb-like protein n=1 Tax=Dorcoceras hygrometricum TaxID=472368 RepID=A0A2Z7BI31_9LAMI|nr:hypothetical protein F511_00445 [Dorcoceras hygrometricum]